MKTLLSVILVAFFMVTATAQEKRSKLSPDQMAELQTKKMALALDLNDGQQRELLRFNKELAGERKQKMEKYKAMKEKGEKLSDEERYTFMNEQLDKKLAVQKKMKSILNEEQYRQWRKMNAMKGKKRAAAKKQRMRRQRSKRW